MINMDNKYIEVPFYSIDNNELKYLQKYKICDLPNDNKIKEYILRNEGVLVSKIEKNKYKNKVLVLEPHCDDFALSALSYTLNKYNVKVLNVFSETSIDYFTWNHLFKITPNEYEKLRLNESVFAIEEVLGEEFISLREKSTRINNKTQKELTQKIIDSVLEILKKDSSIETIMIPMGIGNHPDHLIVYEAIMNNKKLLKEYNLILYPEYPYSRRKNSYHDRLKEIECEYAITPIFESIEDKLETITDITTIYKSQYDDINRNQMLAIIREDARAIACDNDLNDISFVYYKVQ